MIYIPELGLWKNEVGDIYQMVNDEPVLFAIHRSYYTVRPCAAPNGKTFAWNIEGHLVYSQWINPLDSYIVEFNLHDIRAECPDADISDDVARGVLASLKRVHALSVSEDEMAAALSWAGLEND